MSKTKQKLFENPLELKPQHLDALHLISLFVNSYDKHRHNKNNSVKHFNFINSMDVFRKQCENYGF